jgi:hypothetical protein
MSRYEPLAQFLRGCNAPVRKTSFVEIEKILGFPLPPSAHRYNAWWANQQGKGHSQVAGWVGAGWRTRAVDLIGQSVEFERQSASKSLEKSSSDLWASLDLWERARAFTGIADKDQLIAEGLKALIAREAARQLIALGGTMPDLVVPPRERPSI